MANEITKVTDQNGVDHPFKDVAAFPRSEQAVLGAKNLNNHNATTSDSQDVTYTVNTNKTVSLSGIATANSIKDLRTYTGAELKALGKDLILNGGNANAYLAIRTSDYTMIAKSTGGDAPFDTSTLTDGTTYYETIGVLSGVDTTGIIIKPMIRLGSDPDPTFAPPAMTNKELTEFVNDSVRSGKHAVYAIVSALTPSDGKKPEFFIPWFNPYKKPITFDSNFKIYNRENGSWNELVQATLPDASSIAYTQNGFYIGANLATALTSNKEYVFKIQGDIVFS